MRAYEGLIIAFVSIVLAWFAWGRVENDPYGIVGIVLFVFAWAIGVTVCLGV